MCEELKTIQIEKEMRELLPAFDTDEEEDRFLKLLGELSDRAWRYEELG